jgi:hypothetical protein
MSGRRCSCALFPSWRSHFKEVVFPVCLGSGLCCSYNILITIAGPFVFLFHLFVVGLSASEMSYRYFVVAEARYNWCLRIFLYFLCRKMGLRVCGGLGADVGPKFWQTAWQRTKFPASLVESQ